MAKSGGILSRWFGGEKTYTSRLDTRSRTPGGGEPKQKDTYGGIVGKFLSATLSHFNLGTALQPPDMRARRPYSNHAWVYIAVSAIVQNFRQLPFQVMQETEEATAQRASAVRRSGKAWTGPKAGTARTAQLRFLSQPGRSKGYAIKGAEPLVDHPLQSIFVRPNPLMTADELWEATLTWMLLHGEVYWLLTDENDSPVLTGTDPARVYVVPPEALEKVYEGNRLLGYRYRPNVRTTTGPSVEFALPPSAVIPFKFFNPDDTRAGLTPLQAASSEIYNDMLALAYGRSTLENNMVPAGFIETETGGDDIGADEDRLRSFKAQLDELHTGATNAKRTCILPPGFKWKQATIAPQDMEFLEQARWDRETILGVYGVPKSVVSVTDDLNYATATVQDFAFWNKTLLSIVSRIEKQLEATLFFPYTDNIFGAFDLSRVDALRAGMDAKAALAEKLAGDKLHMPPRMAFGLAGLEVPDYPGIDVALVSPALVPVEFAMEGPPPEPEPEPAPSNAPDDKPPPKSSARSVHALGSVVRAGRKDRYWTLLNAKLARPMERHYGATYRKWISRTRREQLALFDEVAEEIFAGKTADPAAVARVIGQSDYDALLLDVSHLQGTLRGQMRPTYASELERLFEFTAEVDIGGVPVLTVDDPRLLNFLDAREGVLLGNTPVTLQNALRETIRKGIDAGETMIEVRGRIARTFDTAGSASKTLSWARTETGGFIDGGREVVFDGQGIQASEWVTGGDEHVREAHAVYGASGPHPRTFDYLSIRPTPNTKGGSLRHAHDPNAPADEIVNCRCCMIPVS